MTILLEQRAVFSNILLYPANDAARVVTFLTGRKCISKSDIAKLKQLGHEVKLTEVEL